jgi:uncharacterized protein YhjY with autotransporter beta-barrel domain
MILNDLLKYAFTGLLLTAPLCAFATDVDVPHIITNTTQQFSNMANVGVYLDVTANDTGTVYYDSQIGNIHFNNSPSITIRGIDVFGFAGLSGAYGVIGVGINNNALSSSTYSLANTAINTGNITLNGDDNTNVIGFIHLSQSAATLNTLDIGDVKVTNSNMSNNSKALGVGFLNITQDAQHITGTITVGKIDVTGQTATGFWSDRLQNATVTLDDVNTDNNDVNFLAGTTGVKVGVIDVNSILTVNNVTVKNAGTNNFPAGSSGSVTGVHVSNIEGKLKTGNVTVDSAANKLATGIKINSIASNSIFNVGKVDVTSAGDAVGININNKPTIGINTLTITQDVIAKSTGTNPSRAVGINVNNVADNATNLTIDTTDRDIQISGIGNANSKSIAMGAIGNYLTITGNNTHANKNQKFVIDGADNVIWKTNADYVTGSSFTTNVATTHKVATGKNVVIRGEVNVGNNAYTVGDVNGEQFQGTLIAQQLTANDVTIHNGTLALDATKPQSISKLTVGNSSAIGKATIEFYGNVAPNNTLLTLTETPVLYPNGQLLSSSTISEYAISGNTIIARNRKRAALSDGFLLPASIHNRITAWEATRDHFISGGGRYAKSGRESLCQTPCNPCEAAATCDPCEATCNECSCDHCDHYYFGSGLLFGASVGRSAWANYVNRSNDYRSSYSNIGIANGDWDIESNGVQVGLDLCKTQRSQLGLLFGYEDSRATLRSDRLEADDIYVGAYAARVFHNGADIRVIYNYGSQDYKLRRFDHSLGLNTHQQNSAFDGNTHEVNIELGKRFFCCNGWSYRPVIGFDLILNEWDGATENGNNATAIIYNDTDFKQAFIRSGFDLKYTCGSFDFNSGLYYSYDLKDDSLQARVSAKTLPSSSSMLFGSDLGRSYLTFNVGSSFALSNCASIFGGFTGDAALDSDGDNFQSIGYVGLKWQW